MGEIPIKCCTVSAVLLRKSDRGPELLLMERADSLAGTWCQVAGRVEDGETGWEAALREIKEETGLTPEAFYSADFCEQFYEPKRNCISLLPVFVGWVDESASVVLNEEHHQFAWFSFEAARAKVSFAGQVNLLSHVEREFCLRDPSDYLKIEATL